MDTAQTKTAKRRGHAAVAKCGTSSSAATVSQAGVYGLERDKSVASREPSPGRPGRVKGLIKRQAC